MATAHPLRAVTSSTNERLWRSIRIGTFFNGRYHMTYTFTVASKIPASPQEIYDAWLDSLAHSAMTGGEANMSDQIGAEVSAWDGYIRGRNIELVPGKQIVQSWRTSEFTDEHEDSIVTVVLEETDDGTLLTLVHSNVPEDQRSYEEGGWQSHYFEPMAVYFRERSGKAVTSSPKKTAKRAAPKAKRAPRATSKRAVPRRKSASAQSKTKRGAAAKAKAKRKTTAKAKPGKPKSAKRKSALRKRR
jgi:uncharacterized protein YndB with AHSA1/START domain